MTRADFASASALWQRAAAQDAFRESAVRGWMTALAREGNPAAVTQVYRDLRLLLSREMRMEPDAETRALYERLRAEGRGGKVLTSKTAPVTPLSVPTGLRPRPLTELVGRTEEVGTVGGLLFGARLVTLTGPGGVGKTRLSIRVAEAWAEDQPDGVWFVDLARSPIPPWCRRRLQAFSAFGPSRVAR